MRNSRLRWRTLSVRCLAFSLLAGLVPAAYTTDALAVTVSGATPVRIGLMLNSNSIQTATDTVTLQGRGGLGIGFYDKGVFKTLSNSTTAVKSSLDNYFVTVGEYDVLDQAQAMADRIDQLGLSYDIYVESRSGKPKYQVISGYYEFRTEADAALSRLKATLGTGTVRGYNRLTTGPLASQAAAEQKVDGYRSLGFDAYAVVRKTGTWEVWVGNEGTPAELEALNAKISAKWGSPLAKADFSTADYLIFKTSAFGGGSIPHVILNSSVEEAGFVPSGSPAVTKVFEKSNREYRGAILVQGYNKKPNVINYVSLDDYLYGVLPQEMSTGWPLEALKAQAVAARTYAARRIGGNKWGTADLSDDVWDQAYRGFSREASDTNAAVDGTQGQVLTYNGSLIEALFSSNNGGHNGDVKEIWGSSGYPYLTAVDGEFDRAAAEREPLYDRVQLPNGMIGWMKAAYVTPSGKNAAGLATGTISASGQPIRTIPDAYADVLVNSTSGTRVVILDEEKEYNPYNWQRGPYSPQEIASMINENQINGYPTVSGPVYDLRVSKVVQGERMGEITADGKPITVKNPDYYRAIFNDMWSTRVTVEQQGTYTVLGANGVKSEYPSAKLQGQTLSVISGSGTVASAVNGTNSSFVVVNASGQSRVVKKDQSYIFHGYGYGHGLGMSQWGARGMAEKGYTYDQILAHYYTGVVLTPKQ
ncbi:SpoIID/LytB domain-containing protein [Tumebacillus permanentifrigoris]|uniref:Stage II sporulation protein D n=1 Tax=Tumebacillus permanentifrigoris TaxID=378543 RepID=A0A316D6P9_9BACL|nr:SpoIID/LytB domain-containing protein [Tumebacillus permanentifrigoris]PWK08972.1 stage II sporulation protein D [Tumebacillus permanentifrigoris]